MSYVPTPMVQTPIAHTPTMPAQRVPGHAGHWPSALLIAIIFVSFRPFQGSTDPLAQPAAAGGDIVNQIGFASIGLICGYLFSKFSPARTGGAFLKISWVLMAGVLLMSVFTADSPSSAARAMIFALIVIFAAACALSMPRTLAEMVSALFKGTAIALAFCYVAVIFFPSQGVHSGGGFEPQHAGLWRGVFDHKNVASYVMGVFVMIGLFVMRNGRPWGGFALMIFSTIFVVFAGSKTVLGILPIAIFFASVAGWITFAPLRLLVVLTPVVVLTTVTIGAVIYEPILEELQLLIPGLTYTGRTDLWTFGLQFLGESPVFGYGFESFWGTQRVSGLEQPIELSWDVRGIVHGHNSWLDAGIGFGIPGVVIVFLTLVFVPVIDYLRIPQSGNAARLASLYIGIWIFAAMGANLESFFFRRADPVWFCMLLAVIGLRLCAHMSRKPRSSPIPAR